MCASCDDILRRSTNSLLQEHYMSTCNLHVKRIDQYCVQIVAVVVSNIDDTQYAVVKDA